MECSTTLMLPTRRSDLVTRTVDGEVVIFDRAGGYVHRLNATASRIWNDCDGRKTASDMASGLAASVGVQPAELLDDVNEALASFERLGLLLTEGDTPAF
jgi:hypothetical protein